jgi:hypothetical protein
MTGLQEANGAINQKRVLGDPGFGYRAWIGQLHHSRIDSSATKIE